MKSCPNCKTTEYLKISDHISSRYIDEDGSIILKVVISCSNPYESMCLWGYCASFKEMKDKK